jgi:hypothetical protein
MDLYLLSTRTESLYGGVIPWEVYVSMHEYQGPNDSNGTGRTRPVLKTHSGAGVSYTFNFVRGEAGNIHIEGLDEYTRSNELDWSSRFDSQAGVKKARATMPILLGYDHMYCTGRSYTKGRQETLFS